MDVCDHGGIPGKASQRTRLEGVEVVSSTGYDHFYDFIRQAMGRFVRNMYPLRLGRIIERVTDVGFTPTPNCFGMFSPAVRTSLESELLVHNQRGHT